MLRCDEDPQNPAPGVPTQGVRSYSAMSPRACVASLTPAVYLSKGVIACVTVYTRNGALQALSVPGKSPPSTACSPDSSLRGERDLREVVSFPEWT